MFMSCNESVWCMENIGVKFIVEKQLSVLAYEHIFHVQLHAEYSVVYFGIVVYFMGSEAPTKIVCTSS